MFLRGQVIKSTAGRDKGYLMAVVSADESFVYVSDGKERRLANPKRKNPKHIWLMSETLTDQQMNSDKALRKALAQIESTNE